MKVSVRSAFRAFNAPFEGAIAFMYVDVKNLVTVGVGDLIDPISQALSLPFRYNSKQGAKAGALASRADIEAEWNKIKGAGLALKGHRACEPLTTLVLNDSDIDTLIMSRLDSNEAEIKRHRPFGAFENWPADAQMGVLSMAWAMGAGFGRTWPTFSATCEKEDFDKAAATCKMNEAGNPGLVPRNKANKQLFENAAAVIAGETAFYKRDQLYYPTWLLKPIVVTPED